MGQCFLYGNGGAALNFAVKRYESEGQLQTDTPQENTIGVVTGTAFQEYAFSADHPGLIYKDVELITESVTLGKGYIGSSGGITGQTAANPELYTETYIPVKYGETYQYKYTVSASKSMYLSITEYTGSYTFKQQLVPVSSVTGTEQTGTYTPSESGITAVRLSWRTFPSTTYTMSFIHKNEAADDGTVSEGMIWIVTGTAGRAAFNALRRNTVMVYPNSVKQYIGGTWKDVSAKVYQGGAWVQIAPAWNGELFDNGNQYEDVTGGWSVDNSYYGSGSIGTTIVGGSGGNNADQGSRIYTNKAVQSVAYQTFKFTVTKASGYNTFYLKSDSISGTKVAYHTFNSTEGTFSIAIPSGLASFYPYLQTGGKGKCTITKVWME